MKAYPQIAWQHTWLLVHVLVSWNTASCTQWTRLRYVKDASICLILEFYDLYFFFPWLFQTRMQSLCPVTGTRHIGIYSTISSMVRYEGLFRPFRGMSAVVAGAGPAHAMFFSSYEVLKNYFSASGKVKSDHIAHGKNNLHRVNCWKTKSLNYTFVTQNLF